MTARLAALNLFVAALLGVAILLSAAAGAAAAPKVALQVVALPIPGFPGTGDILGAAAAVQVRVTISGTEYGGFPSPLTQMALYAPVGFKVATSGFAACAPAALEAGGAPACPKRSRAGPVGEGLGVVSFGGERVDEKVSIQGFFAPGGGLTFNAEGRTPASFQVLESAHWTTAGAPYGPEMIVDVPLVETVPGADDASILSFKVTVGAAYRRGSRTISYLTLPERCPRGGAPIRADLKFLSGEIVTVAYRQPCPRHARRG
ncbi:MAG TPA: hypothetical protein VGI76_05590 [Solirubrobacteraceae bacterium]|jgi:hypothetical protein